MPGYSETLMEYFQSPKNVGELAPPCLIGRASLGNRAPRMTLYLRVDREQISAASFQTQGCGVAIACCSALTEMVLGRSVKECMSYTAADVEKALDGLPIHKQFCAGLAVEALRDGLDGSSPVRGVGRD